MKVTINFEHGLNQVVGSAIGHAISKHYPLSLQFGCATFTVPDFPSFLECMWAGFYECSMRSLGDQMRRVYDVSVCLDDGSLYGVWIRYDEELRGLRYGGIY